jgi:hypothetical protein
MKIISPERLVAKFIKSATNGRTVSVRKRRILTLIAIPIWLLGFACCATCSYNGVKAIFTYYEAKKNYSPEFDKYMEEDIKKMEPLAQKTYHNPYLKLRYVPKDYESEMRRAKREMFQLLAIPVYLIVFFILPWVITRLVFWIVDADKVTE